MSKKIRAGRYPSKPISIWEFLNVYSLVKTLGVLLIIGITQTAIAQDFTTSNKKAIRSYQNAITAFDQRNHELAIAFLDEALSQDKNFIEAYFLKFEVFSEAGKLPQAKQALETGQSIDPDFFPNAWFYLAAIYFNEGDYSNAKNNFEKFITYRGVNSEMVVFAKDQIENCKFALNAIENPVDFKPTNMGAAINTENPEYYPTISVDGKTFIFTRLDKDPAAYRGKNENFYVSSKRDDTWFPAYPLREVNTIFNEGAPTLSSDGRTLVFTACEFMGDYGPHRKGFGSCDLFMSVNEGNQWQPPVNMGAPINTAHWESQPSLSADGNTLYFIRGTPSRTGVKNQDIYVTHKNAEGKWSVPERLSNKINTPGREESVHIHPDGRTLFFSSNGHTGMGGLDLYVSRKNENGEWDEPVNLGYPINTHADENSILVSSDGKLAFYASDKEGGFGKLDLYTFELPQFAQATPVSFAQGRVSDAQTKEPLGAILQLANVNDTLDSKTFSSDPYNGQFLVALATNATYAMTVKSEGYIIHSETFTLPKELPEKGFAIDVELHKIEEGMSIVLKNIFFDLDKDELKPQSKPELTQLALFLKSNSNIAIEISGHTDNQGDDAHNADLSKRRAESVKNYLVQMENINPERLKTEGYGASKPIASNETEEGRAQNRRTEFKIIGKKD